MDLQTFVGTWGGTAGRERANKDSFLKDLCRVLGVPEPEPATGDDARDRYVFERGVKHPGEDGKVTSGFIDLYKEGHFILEAKQGGVVAGKGTAKRGTPSWNLAMNSAYGQAIGYAGTFDQKPPFLVVCDIGYCFDLYSSFDGRGDYRAFPNAQQHRLYFADFEKHVDTLRAIFVDPLSLDPSRRAAKVTREVAEKLAALAVELDPDGKEAERVAKFLMRCLFTMFAEDVGLLPDKLFTKALVEYWIPSPASFPSGIEGLWRAMNSGGAFYPIGKLLTFNGGLFKDCQALALTDKQLRLLHAAAEKDWSAVEPAIFGTLLERALNPRERHALGAHYTPRAYVERLVRPTIEEPLREEWQTVQIQVHALLEGDKEEQARQLVRDFHRRLCQIRVLDPACGSGNFLYVTLDLFKRLESEVLALLEQLGEKQIALEIQQFTVTPGQFLGIEKKRWAKEIAELVLWIGYLQWHYRTRGKVAPPEPVLRDYGNIEHRDAVLAFDDEVPVHTADGKPLMRWDGETMKKSPVTGEDVPDETAQVPVFRYVNPRKAEWPRADFVVGNPPYIGNKRMRLALGDGYVEALRSAHEELSDAIDLVMYWWHSAAARCAAGALGGFGFITTNSITQPFNRRVVEQHDGVSVVWAVPDHPWVDSLDGAAVRVAMTVVRAGQNLRGEVWVVISEREGDDGSRLVDFARKGGVINPDLTVGTSVTDARPLQANSGLAVQGIIPLGDGFRLARQELADLGYDAAHLPREIRRYCIGQDLVRVPEERFVIDFFGLSLERAARMQPALYQRLLVRVKPERDQNKRATRRKNWWLFGENAPTFRRAASGLSRYVATCRTARHRVFVFLDGEVLHDTKIVGIAIADAAALGILSSRVHESFSLRTGGWLGVGNDPTYNHAVCFAAFPFPAATEAQQARIRELGEQLDAHRKRQQAQHPKLTITGMYNVLEKLRAGEALDDKDKVIHEQGLVSVLKQIHDELDAAVFDAYGWPHDLTDEQILERLVALNAERAEEERNGLVRWLRPEFQNPGGRSKAPVEQVAMPGVEAAPEGGDGEEGDEAKVVAAARAWPKKLPERVAALRDLTRGGGAWTVAQTTAAFAGAKKKDVEAVLDSLCAVGVLVSWEDKGVKRYRASARVAA